MSRYRIAAAGYFVLFSALGAVTHAQELMLAPRVGSEGPRAFGADCAAGEIYDDASAEDGYSGTKVVSDFEAVQRFKPAIYPATYDGVCIGLASPGGANLQFEIEVRDDNGAGGGPGTLLGTLPVSASNIPSGLPCRFYGYDISSLGLDVAAGSVWIGVRWDPTAFPRRFVCADETAETPLHPGFVNFNDGAGWQPTETVFPVYRALLVRAVPRVINTGDFSPMALEVDSATALASNGNGILEPGEQVEVAPTWANGGTEPQSILGTALALAGPAGPSYDLIEDEANYGVVAPTEPASCHDGGSCYEMGVGPQGVARPSAHWDATFYETLSDDSAHIWPLHVGDSFTDVPQGNLFYPAIEALLHSGVTGGCTSAAYCPGSPITRSQMAVFALRAAEDAGYQPPACVEGAEEFADVPFDSPFCPWIEELVHRQVVAGCGSDNYCPGAAVTRAQMSIFLLKSLQGGDYVPPECNGFFTDVGCPSLFGDWIEDLHARGITSGCSTDPPAYCPGEPVSRAQMAAFLKKTFGLSPYGP